MNVICTGISKCDKLNYLKAVRKYSKELKKGGKDIQIYSVGDIMQECLKHYTTVNEHILNRDDELLAQAAESALKTIKIDILEEKLKGKKEKHNIISTHTMFVWKHHWKEAHNEEFLGLLEPELFITILDHEKRIQERQHKDSQWKLRNLGLETIALWQDKEARETEKWAKRFGKRHLVIGRNQAPETLYKILNYPQAPVFYANFPMTYLQDPEKSYAKITENNKEMRKYGPVIDPRTIEIMKPGESDYSYTPQEKKILAMLKGKKNLTKFEKEVKNLLDEKKEFEKEIIKCATVHRDLDYYVAKADVDVLYFPELVLSFGGVAEVIKAHRCTKPTYLILPEKFRNRDIGPFEVYHSLKIFFGAEEFHEFLAETYTPLNM